MRCARRNYFTAVGEMRADIDRASVGDPDKVSSRKSKGSPVRESLTPVVTSAQFSGISIRSWMRISIALACTGRNRENYN
jgi:hypothetical protein